MRCIGQCPRGVSVAAAPQIYIDEPAGDVDVREIVQSGRLFFVQPLAGELKVLCRRGEVRGTNRDLAFRPRGNDLQCPRVVGPERDVEAPYDLGGGDRVATYGLLEVRDQLRKPGRPAEVDESRRLRGQQEVGQALGLTPDGGGDAQPDDVRIGDGVVGGIHCGLSW